MDNAKKDLAERLKSANNILVTVSRNPSVDQLASCLGLSILLNKQGKHTAAVFSGQVPSTLEFLKPEETLEQNTDSLRDFIIALDKSKADKLRYKVEDNVVRIFITPYKTSISDADLEFSQGDFNVDVVVALGVSRQEDLDEAITAHGRILHDATVASINTTGEGGLGSISWNDPKASSLSELVTDLAQALGPNLLDTQIATALLTGIVSETDRFSNDKTSSQTMNASATLMAAGANQQLVASKLEEAEQPFAPKQEQYKGTKSLKQPQNPDGMIEIDHTNDPQTPPAEDLTNPAADPVFELPSPDASALPAEPVSAATFTPPPPPAPEAVTPESHLSPGPKYIESPPTLGGTLTANSDEESYDTSINPYSMPVAEPPVLIGQKLEEITPPEPPAPPAPPVPPAPAAFTPPPPTWVPPADPRPPLDPVEPAKPSQDFGVTGKELSLSDLEAAVKKSEAEEAAGLDNARDEVSRALTNAAATSLISPEPIQALNAQPLGGSLHQDLSVPEPLIGPAQASPQEPSLEEQIPGIVSPQVTNANAPPPVPPPIPFQFGNTPQQH